MGTYDTEAARIKRQRMIADALRESGNTPVAPSIHTGGRFDAPVSGWEYANRALEKVLAAYNSRQADKADEKLSEKDKAQLADLMDAARNAQAPDATEPAPSSDEGPTRVPANYLPKADRQRQLQAAALRGQQFGGSSEPIANEIMKRELFPPVQQPYTLGADEVRFGADNTPVATGLPRTVNPGQEDRETMNIVDKAQPNGYRTIRRKDLKPGDQEYFKPTGGAGSAQMGVGLDPDVIHNGAMDIIRNGPSAMYQYVSRSAADKPTRDALNNEVVKIMRESGLTNDQVARFRGRVAGELKSQKDLVGMKNAVESYEKLAKFNGERLLQLVEGVDTTGIPAVEGALRYAKSKGGSVDAAEFASVLKNYQTEVARVINQPRLVGQLTDTQIEEMKKVVDGSASAPQLRRVINRLNLEMDMRSDAIKKQLDTSGDALAIPGQTPPAAAPAAADPNDHSSLWK